MALKDFLKNATLTCWVLIICLNINLNFIHIKLFYANVTLFCINCCFCEKLESIFVRINCFSKVRIIIYIIIYNLIHVWCNI